MRQFLGGLFGLCFGLLTMTFAPLAHAGEDEELPAWADHPLLAQCFSSPAEFITAARADFGSNALLDENIRVLPVQSLSDGSVFVVDFTPSANPPWYLLERYPERGFCLTLYVSAASNVTVFHNEDSGLLWADAYTQAPPSYPALFLHLERTEIALLFRPTICREEEFYNSFLDKIIPPREVPCDSLFED